MPGRNEPCHCGSGLKYKKCCLLRDFPRPAQDPELEAWKQADSTLNRKGMDAITKYDHDLPKLLDMLWGKGAVAFFQKEGIVEDELYQLNYWLLLDYRPEPDRKTLAERMLSEASLSDRERQLLASQTSVSLSLYQVSRVEPGRGVEFEDVLSGGRTFVHDFLLSNTAEKWTLGFGRVFPAGPFHFCALAVPTAFPPWQKADILAILKQELAQFRKRNPGAQWPDLFGDRAHILGPLVWHLHELAERLPELSNADGDDLVICRATIQVSNAARFLQKLGKHRDFFEDATDSEGRACFAWIRRRDDRHLGSITIQGSTLLLECNSRERLERGLKLLRKIGPLEIEDVEERTGENLMRQAREQAVAREDEPLAVTPPKLGPKADEVIRDFVQEHYQKWVDEPLPILGNQTPGEASRTPAGREKLRDLLRTMEFGDRNCPQDDPMRTDWNALRQRLGILWE